MMIIDPKDLIIDTYRSNLKGGTWGVYDCGVQVTHLPTGVQTRCGSGRNQHHNRGTAVAEMERLLSAREETTPAFTLSDVKLHWGPNFPDYLVDLLNGDDDLDSAREDLRSLIRKEEGDDDAM